MENDVERLRELLREFDNTISATDTAENARLLAEHHMEAAQSESAPIGKLNVIFLGSLQPHTLPYLTCSEFADRAELFAALDTSWICLSEAMTHPRLLLLRKAIHFTGNSMRTIDFGRHPVVIHYLYNKNRKLDREAGISSAASGANPDFEALVDNKVATMVVFQEQELRSPKAIAFTTTTPTSPSFLQDIYRRGQRDNRIVSIADPATAAQQVKESLRVLTADEPDGSQLVVKPALGAQGRGIRVYRGVNAMEHAAARVVTMLGHPEKSVVTEEVASDVVVEKLVPMPLGSPWNIRVLAGTDAARAIRIYGMLVRCYDSGRFHREHVFRLDQRPFRPLLEIFREMELSAGEQKSLIGRVEELTKAAFSKLLSAVPSHSSGRLAEQQMAGFDIVISKAIGNEPYLIEANGIGSGGIEILGGWSRDAPQNLIPAIDPVVEVLRTIIETAQSTKDLSE